MVIFNKGAIEQAGQPLEVSQAPVSPFVMNFVGDVNHLPSGCQVGWGWHWGHQAGRGGAWLVRPGARGVRVPRRPAPAPAVQRAMQLACPALNAWHAQPLSPLHLPRAAGAPRGLPHRQALCHVPPHGCARGACKLGEAGCRAAAPLLLLARTARVGSAPTLPLLTPAPRLPSALPCHPLPDYVVSKDFSGGGAGAAPATVHDKQDVGRLVRYYLRFDDGVVRGGGGGGGGGMGCA